MSALLIISWLPLSGGNAFYWGKSNLTDRKVIEKTDTKAIIMPQTGMNEANFNEICKKDGIAPEPIADKRGETIHLFINSIKDDAEWALGVYNLAK